jgi:disulfide bond formation protein DsbB
MYPLVVLFYFGFIKKDVNVFLYTLPLAILGFSISLYHYGLQKIDFLSKYSVCKVGVPCNSEYINWLGFITIPFLSLIAFTMIIGFSIYILKTYKKE